MTGSTAPESLGNTAAPSSRGRSAAIGAVAFVLLGLPFLVFSLVMLNVKARVELRCDPGGGCTLDELSLLSHERVGVFTLPELLGATVERNRSSKADAANLYKPVLKTTRGDFPLSTRWLEDEAQAERTARVVNLFHANPLGGGNKSFLLFHDHRRGPLIVGSSFGAMSLVLFGLSVWMALKARRHLRAERSARASPPTA
ncbi:MAG: hypothetical protein ACJ8AT_22590 [Hyalangium sp.]|uniref:hypothetical protein n=1 Tax=Hyalangium sp. TaxID=2028555 RepID=UPI00389A30DF